MQCICLCYSLYIQVHIDVGKQPSLLSLHDVVKSFLLILLVGLTHIIKISMYHNNQCALFTRCQFCMVTSKLPPSTYSSCASITQAPPPPPLLLLISHHSFTNSLCAAVYGTAWEFCMGCLPISTHPPLPTPTQYPYSNTKTCTYSTYIHTHPHTHTYHYHCPNPSILSCLPPSLSALGWHVMVALVCSLPLPLVY